MAIAFLSNLNIKSPLPTDEKYRVHRRSDLIDITSTPGNYPYLGMVSYVSNDNEKNGLYILKKEPNLKQPPSSGIVASDWLKLSISAYSGLAADVKPVLDAEDIGTFLYETDTQDLLLWDGVAWTSITSGGSGGGGFVEVASASALPPIGIPNTMYVTVDTNYAYRWNAVAVPPEYEQLGAAPGGAVMISTVKSTLLTSVGGIDPGDEVLIGTDIQGLVEQLINPFRDPIAVPNSMTITQVASTAEVGSVYTKTLTAPYNAGNITSTNDPASPQIPLTGPMVSTIFTGNGIGSASGIISHDVVAGTVGNSWTATINYSQGTGDYFDSIGAQSCIFDDGVCAGTPSGNGDGTRAAGSISKTTNSINGIYPFLFGMSPLNLLSGGVTIYQELYKRVVGKGNHSLPLNGINEYIYIAYPAGYGALTSIFDQNGFDVTSTFIQPPTTADITSFGLGTDYTESFLIYRTAAKTDVSGFSYTIKF